MSMTEAPSLVVPPLASAPDGPARSRFPRTVVVWETAKAVFAVTTFTAVFLPLAFPSKAGTQALPAQLPGVEALQAAAKPQAPKAVAPAKTSAPPQPVKKPLPKHP